MKKNQLVVCSIILMMGLAGAACSLPGVAAPTPFVFPTADYTLTAIFSVLGSLTPQPPVQGQTPGSPDVTTPGAGDAATQALPATLPPDVATPVPTTPVPTTISLPTDTPVPSNTPRPTSTATQPPARSAASIVASYLSHSPDIDGDLSDWDLSDYSVNHVVYGADVWDNKADLSATVMVGWDEDYLYLGAHVVDEDYVQNAHGADLYKGDSLEVLFDTNLTADFYTNSLSPDDFQLGISPGSPTVGDHPEAYLWFPADLAGSRNKVKIVGDRNSKGYDVEVAIPWSVFEIDPVAGKHYGFTFSVSDNDKTGYSVQQSMISNVSNRHLTDPTTWGDLLLARP